MRSKRITMLMLSAVMALTTVGFTASAVSADEDHPNIIVQAAIRLDNIDTANGYYRMANQSYKLLRDIRHWVNNHGVGPYGVPPLVNRLPNCGDDNPVTLYKAWLVETRALARQGFRYYRGMATKWQEFPSGWERTAAKVRARIVFNRVEGRQADAQKDFLNCIFDALPRRAVFLYF